MPGMDGLELLEKLRNDGNDIPFIILTGQGREEIAIRALNLGADYYVQKIMDIKLLYPELAHVIRNAVKHRQAEEALRKAHETLEQKVKMRTSELMKANESLKYEIAERKQAEEALWNAYAEFEELQHIISRSPAVVFLRQNAEGWPVEFVSQSVRQFGYVPEDFLSGKISFTAIIHPEDLENVLKEVMRYNKDESKKIVQEYRIITSSGDVRWLDDRTWIRRDTNGTITHF